MGKLLVHRLSHLSSSRQIPKIHTSCGTSLDPREIENKVDMSELDYFFQPLLVPNVSHDLVEKLERPITVEDQFQGLMATWQRFINSCSPG